MNEFATLLQKLVKVVGIKNNVIAKNMQYDVSYVSKWLNGHALPAERNADIVIHDLIFTIIAHADGAALSELMYEYKCEDNETLKTVLSETLIRAYQAQKVGSKASLSDVQYHASLRMIDVVKCVHEENSTSMVAVIDLLSLDHDSRLVMAGIINGQFSRTSAEHGVHFSLGLFIPDIEGGDAVYDSIFLIHLLTSYSGLDFCLYALECATGKCLYAAKDRYAISGTPFSDDTCFAVTEVRDLAKVNHLYNKLFSLMEQEKLIFRKICITDFIGLRFYLQSLVSENKRWLLGHVTEHLLPKNVFESLSMDVDLSLKSAGKDCYSKLCLLSTNAISERGARVMLYDSALAKFALTGEVDFINSRKFLDEAQRLEFFDYLYDIVKNGLINLKLVYGGFSSDFNHITNPCMFLSDTFCYLRLENDRYADNLMVLKNQKVKDMFDKFFEIIWNDKPEIVEENTEKILNYIKRYRDSMRLLTSE